MVGSHKWGRSCSIAAADACARGRPGVRSWLPEALESRRLFSAFGYQLVDLGTLGGSSSEAFDINNANQIVGRSRGADGAYRAFRFADANGDGAASPGEMRNLGVFGTDVASFAYGINDAGVVVGASKASEFGRELAVQFDAAAGTVTDLGLGNYSAAYEVNASGAIAGYADNPAAIGQNRGFVRGADGTAAYFSLPGSATTEAFAINDAGEVAGRALGPNGFQAFRRSADGVVTEIGFARQAGRRNQAADINAAGLIAGEGVTPAGDYRAFLEGAGGPTSLGTVNNFGSSFALGVNAKGDVVGALDVANTPGNDAATRGFVYAGGQMVDLNTRIFGDTDLLIAEARAINDAGYIVGTGIRDDGETRESRAILLVPMPGVSSVLVNGGGAQRSKVTNVVVTFNAPVSVDAGAFEIVKRGGGAVAGVVGTVMGDETTYNVTFDTTGLPGKSLTDGIYDLRVVGSKVHDIDSESGAEPLDGTFTFAFHRLYADADGDGDVDNADRFDLRSTTNKRAGNPAFKSYFDHDGDGDVDNADLFEVRGRARIAFRGY